MAEIDLNAVIAEVAHDACSRPLAILVEIVVVHHGDHDPTRLFKEGHGLRERPGRLRVYRSRQRERFRSDGEPCLPPGAG